MQGSWAHRWQMLAATWLAFLLDCSMQGTFDHGRTTGVQSGRRSAIRPIMSGFCPRSCAFIHVLLTLRHSVQMPRLWQLCYYLQQHRHLDNPVQSLPLLSRWI